MLRSSRGFMLALLDAQRRRARISRATAIASSLWSFHRVPPLVSSLLLDRRHDSQLCTELAIKTLVAPVNGRVSHAHFAGPETHASSSDDQSVKRRLRIRSWQVILNPEHANQNAFDAITIDVGEIECSAPS